MECMQMRELLLVVLIVGIFVAGTLGGMFGPRLLQAFNTNHTDTLPSPQTLEEASVSTPIEIATAPVPTKKQPEAPTADIPTTIPVTPSKTTLTAPHTTQYGCTPASPSSSLSLHSFYKKACVIDGIPIIGSAAVSDEAFLQGAAIMHGMLAERPDILRELAKHDLKIALMDSEEVTTMLPEYAYLKNDTQTNWDTRARGLGATLTNPLVSGAEENVLCLASDVYKGESILLHELAHSIKDLGVAFIDTSFDARLAKAYTSALEQGLWSNTYAATNKEEYWAEGVQSYFDTNISAIPSNGIHNSINTRAKLKTYDAGLYALIAEIFPTDWRYRCGL